MESGAQRLGGLFARRGDLAELVRAGERFRRVLADRTVETAQILDVFPDAHGIPHVRFELSIARPGRTLYHTGPRTVALSTFGRNFDVRRSA